MNKKALSLILAVLMLCCAFPMTAYAENETEASTDLTYYLSAGSVNPIPDDPEPVQTAYEVLIPTQVNLLTTQSIYITATSVSLADSQTLVVSIDGNKTPGVASGKLYLFTGDGSSANKRMDCFVFRGSTEQDSTEAAAGNPDVVVATFKNGNTQPHTYGCIRISPTYADSNYPGTYTGTIYFTIAITGS